MPGASTTRSAGIASCPRERWRKAPTRRSAASTSDHRPGTDLGAVRRHRPHRQRAPAAVLRAREVHERVDRAALEHRRRAAPVRPRRPRAARPGDRDGAPPPRAPGRRGTGAAGRDRGEAPRPPGRRRGRSDASAHRDVARRPHRLRGRRLDSRRAPDRYRARRPPPDHAARHLRARHRGRDRLVDALRDLVDAKGDPGKDARFDMPTRAELRTRQVMAPRDAFYAPTEMVKARDAVGRVSAELVTPYPPGIPAAVPGELYTPAIVDYVEQVAAAGGYLEGAVDAALDRLRVVA